MNAAGQTPPDDSNMNWVQSWLSSFMQNDAGASLLWITLTVLAFMVTMELYRKSRAHPLMLPVVTGTLIIASILFASDTPYATYFRAVSPLVFLIGPATVALAVPLFGQLATLRSIWRPIAVALAVGSVVAIGSALLIAWTLGGSAITLISVAPKSATIPIATSLSEYFGGVASLAAVAVAITGIIGTMISGPLLRRMVGSLDDVTYGFTLGLTAHAIGTARAIQHSEKAGAFAALAMSLNGVLTALLMPCALALAAWMEWLN